MKFIWQSLSMVFILLSIRGDCKEECMSALKLQAVGNTVFDLVEKALKTRENAIGTSWILQLNDTEVGISLNYSVKCQEGCQHCNDESLRPHPPQEIAYTSTTGSNLCFKWKGSVSKNYTTYYTQGRGYCSDMYTRCTADRLENDVLECCPQNLHPVAPIYVRVDYENEYNMYVYGILYWLRAQTIAIPNPLKNFTYQLLDDTTVKFMFEDPEDWNFDSFSLLDKRICQKSPLVEESAKCKTKAFQYPPNSWTISGLSFDTQYIYTAQCYRIEGRWSEEKSITFHTGGNANSSTTPGPYDPVSMEIRNTSTRTTVTIFASTRTVQNHLDSLTRPDKYKVTTEMSTTVTAFASTQNQPTSTTVTMIASTKNQPKTTTVTIPDQYKVGLILAGFLIAPTIVFLYRAYRCVHKRLFWKIPEPNIPPIIRYSRVDLRVPNIIVEKEVFDELKTRNKKLSVSWNNGVDSGQGTFEGTRTPDESSSFIEQFPFEQDSANHIRTHRGVIYENVDDIDEDCMGSNHGNGAGIGGVSFLNLIYENKLLGDDNMERKVHEFVNDDDSRLSDDDEDDGGDVNCDNGSYNGDDEDEVNDNDDDDNDADGDVSGMAAYTTVIHENSDDIDEECMGSNHGNGAGICGVSFLNLIYENKLLENDNMERKVHEYVNDDDSRPSNDDDDDDGADVYGDNDNYNGDDNDEDEVNDNDDDDHDADIDVSGIAAYTTIMTTV